MPVRFILLNRGQRLATFRLSHSSLRDRDCIKPGPWEPYRIGNDILKHNKLVTQIALVLSIVYFLFHSNNPDYSDRAGASGDHPPIGLNIGDILTFGCALSFAVHVIFQDRYLGKGINMNHFYLTQVMFVTLFCLLGVVFIEGPIFYMSERLLIAILVTGILGTFVSFLLMIWAQTLLSANQTAVLLSLEPVFAALFSTFFAGEILGFYGWGGGFIIVLQL